MNYFLALVILAICVGVYYEHTAEQQKSAADQQQISDLGVKIDSLQSENKKLEDDKAELEKSLKEAQGQTVDLTAQIQTVKQAQAEAVKQAEQAQLVVHPPPPPPTPPPPTNGLGTITTLDGKTFQNCLLLKVEADGITFSHSSGITKILFGRLSPELQKKFGYDPHMAAQLTEAEIQYQEARRKAADQAAGH